MKKEKDAEKDLCVFGRHRGFISSYQDPGPGQAFVSEEERFPKEPFAVVRG